MIKHADSHLDHGLTDAQVAHILERFRDRGAFFIETFELPEELGTVPCGLYGPLMGDTGVVGEFGSFVSITTSDGVTLAPFLLHQRQRDNRAYKSRCIAAPLRQVRTMTVIAGPHKAKCATCEGTGKVEVFHFGHAETQACERCDGDGHQEFRCVLYTAFGGPLAPQEPGDIRQQIEALELQRIGERGQAMARGETYSDETNSTYAKILQLREKRAIADAFWANHALAVSPS